LIPAVEIRYSVTGIGEAEEHVEFDPHRLGKSDISLAARRGRRKRLTAIMPVPGLDPGIVAGIHVFLASLLPKRRGWPGQARPRLLGSGSI